MNNLTSPELYNPQTGSPRSRHRTDNTLRLPRGAGQSTYYHQPGSSYEYLFVFHTKLHNI